jgi:hypothetical protein
MKKLSLQGIDDLLTDFYDGTGVTILSRHYGVTKGTIYYHIKKEASKKKIKCPVRYLDHVKNQIFAIEQKIEAGYYTVDQLPCAQGEVRRLRYWLKVDRSSLPNDPYVLQ